MPAVQALSPTVVSVKPVEHAGVHVDEEFWVAVQVPALPPTGNNEGTVQSQGLAMHVAALLKFPRVQIVGPDDVYPALHEILQEAPLANVPVQLPIPPLTTDKLLKIEQPLATHVAGPLKLPRMQIVVPEEVYPALHEILQEAPLTNVPLQLPIPPLATDKLLKIEEEEDKLLKVEQPLATHVAAVSTGCEQLDDPNTM